MFNKTVYSTHTSYYVSRFSSVKHHEFCIKLTHALNKLNNIVKTNN